MSDVVLPDQTLAAMNDALFYAFNNSGRKYVGSLNIGAGSIGEACDRKIWNRFHWVMTDEFSTQGIKAIEDGHHSETVMIKRLRMTPGINLKTENEKGKQFDFKDGHTRGKVDGLISGIHHLPSETHVWEHKCTNEKKFNLLIKHVIKDEMTALFNWDEVYFAAAQTYMHQFKLNWHYLTVSSSGSRDETSCLTAYDPAAATWYRERALNIVKAIKPSPRISETASWFQCKMCPFTGNCHGDTMPLVNCRTCAYSTPHVDGTWLCEKFGETLDADTQAKGCGKHLFNPALVPGEQTDAGDDWIEYKMRDGTTVRNCDAKVVVEL